MNDKEKVVKISEKEPTKMEMLQQWLNGLIFPGKVSDFIEEVGGHGSPEETKRSVCFYTEENQYFITAIERNNGNDYLGCQVSARKPRPGEGWIRGNDLPDGPFTKKTWDTIINAIVSYEIVRLSDYQKPSEIPEDIN